MVKNGLKEFGNKMKQLEQIYAGDKFEKNLPICIRLDGKGFSKYTAHLEKPFDFNFSEVMKQVTEFLIKESNAVIGYTQSDEITLILYSNDPIKSVFFDGKIQKITSILASMATAKFNQLANQYFVGKNVPALAFFDCRAWTVKSKEEAVNVLFWREADATKNSVSIAARSLYKHSEVVNKTSKEMKKMLLKKNVDWQNYPKAFKFGRYLQRQNVFRELTLEELDKIPKKYRTHSKILRSEIVELDFDRINTQEKKVELIFKDL